MFVSGYGYQCVCVLVRVCITQQTPRDKPYIILVRSLALEAPSFGSCACVRVCVCPCILTFDNPNGAHRTPT